MLKGCGSYEKASNAAEKNYEARYSVVNRVTAEVAAAYKQNRIACNAFQMHLKRKNEIDLIDISLPLFSPLYIFLLHLYYCIAP